MDKNRQQIRSNFNKVAQNYPTFANIQNISAKELAERLIFFKINPNKILDIGCGTGTLSNLVSEQYPKANLIRLDWSKRMLLSAEHSNQKLCVCADAVQLPFANQQFDMVISNAMLQWCNDLGQQFQEIRRIIKPDGLFMFTTFGPDTLKEWRDTWLIAGSLHQHTNTFVDMHDIADILMYAGFSDPVVDRESLTITHKTLDEVTQSIKGVGSKTTVNGRSKGLTGKKLWQGFKKHYPQQRNGYPLTWEIIQGHAFNSPIRQAKYDEPFMIDPKEITIHRPS